MPGDVGNGAREELPTRAWCYRGQAQQSPWAGSRMGWAGGCASGCSSLGACGSWLVPRRGDIAVGGCGAHADDHRRPQTAATGRPQTTRQQLCHQLVGCPLWEDMVGSEEEGSPLRERVVKRNKEPGKAVELLLHQELGS